MIQIVSLKSQPITCILIADKTE